MKSLFSKQQHYIFFHDILFLRSAAALFLHWVKGLFHLTNNKNNYYVLYTISASSLCLSMCVYVHYRDAEYKRLSVQREITQKDRLFLNIFPPHLSARVGLKLLRKHCRHMLWNCVLTGAYCEPIHLEWKIRERALSQQPLLWITKYRLGSQYRRGQCL